MWLSGYIPESETERFKAAAAENGWAWGMDDPSEEDEQIPTKVKYTKVTRLMIPVFDILGTVPGYHEYDISFWFLGFFTLFFAMIIGDAGYGCLFLLCAAGLNISYFGIVCCDFRSLARLQFLHLCSNTGFVKIKMQKKGSKKCIGQPAP